MLIVSICFRWWQHETLASKTTYLYESCKLVLAICFGTEAVHHLDESNTMLSKSFTKYWAI